MAPRYPPSKSPKHLPQPTEQISSSNRASSTKDHSSEAIGQQPQKFIPQPVEMSSSYSKKSIKETKSHDQSPYAVPSKEGALPQSVASNAPSPKPRRFAPQMIDTTRRSRRNTDTSPCVTPSDKTDEPHGPQDHLPLHMRQARPAATPMPPENSPVVSSEQIPQVPESKFSAHKLAQKAERRHSFRVPELPAITSQSETGSSASSAPSPSTSPSDESEATGSGKRRKKRRSKAQRESQDGRWAGYLLSLAAKAAEKQLREQAMAAYPNENLHEPVDHYAFDRDSDDSDVGVGVGKLQVDDRTEEDVDKKSAVHRHRDSDAGWGLAEMRKHQEKLEEQKQEEFAKGAEIGRRRSTRSALRDTQQNTAQQPGGMLGAPPKDIMGWQKDNDIKPMQKAASPPMAGENLQFPKCQSPRTTRLDVYQYPGMKKVSDTPTREHTGLWTPGGGASRQNSKSGLWMGFCNVAHQDNLSLPKALPTGLMTPAIERGDPMAAASPSSQHQLPPSPPSSQERGRMGTGTKTLDDVLRRERTIEEELNDAFVTQVYNYLSLGYPSLARKFDEELEKITKVSVADLRKDDRKCNAKGYVGAPEGTGTDVQGLMDGDEKCERWCALRLYVREWGRQQPGMGAVEEIEGGWGARARKGSWAI